MIGEVQPGVGGNVGKSAPGLAGEGKEGKQARPVFYGNLKMYTFFRLYQTMYERLCKAKALGIYPPPHMTCMYPPPHMRCMYPRILLLI